MKCTNCGTENRDGARICRQCGRPLAPSELSTGQMTPGAPPPPSAAAISTCPACGAPIKAGAHFCARCGSSIGPPAGAPGGGPAGPGAVGASGAQPQAPYSQGEPQSYSRSIPQGVPAAGALPEPAAYARPPVEIPPPGAPAPQPVSVKGGKGGAGKKAGGKRKIPVWVIILGVILFLLCAAGTVYAGIQLGKRFFGGEAEVTATTEAVEGEETPGAEVGEQGEEGQGGETETPPAESPTPEPTPAPTDTVAPQPTAETTTESVDLTLWGLPGTFPQLPDTSRLTLNVTVKNIREGYRLEGVRCQLDGRWIDWVTTQDGGNFEASITDPIPFGEQRECVFNVTPKVLNIDLEDLGVYVIGQAMPEAGGSAEQFDYSEPILELLKP